MSVGGNVIILLPFVVPLGFISILLWQGHNNISIWYSMIWSKVFFHFVYRVYTLPESICIQMKNHRQGDYYCYETYHFYFVCVCLTYFIICRTRFNASRCDAIMMTFGTRASKRRWVALNLTFSCSWTRSISLRFWYYLPGWATRVTSQFTMDRRKVNVTQRRTWQIYWG